MFVEEDPEVAAVSHGRAVSRLMRPPGCGLLLGSPLCATGLGLEARSWTVCVYGGNPLSPACFSLSLQGGSGLDD